MLRFAGVPLLLLFGLASAPAQAERVPSVGCAGDGQTGPVAAPRAIPGPDVPRVIAPRLAYYRSQDLGVLAPRGWRCFSLYGSDGAILVVAPGSLGSPPLGSGFRLSGRGLVVRLSFGGTSGRFAVARSIFQLFPTYRRFAERVAAEGIDDMLRVSLPATDRIVRRSATAVDYWTPARRAGLGTSGRMAPGAEGVRGGVILLPGEEPSVVQLDMRLGPRAAREEAAILSHFHASRAAPLRTPR